MSVITCLNSGVLQIIIYTDKLTLTNSRGVQIIKDLNTKDTCEKNTMQNQEKGLGFWKWKWKRQSFSKIIARTVCR